MIKFWVCPFPWPTVQFFSKIVGLFKIPSCKSNSFLFCAWFIQHTKHSSEEHNKDEELMPTVYRFVFPTRNRKEKFMEHTGRTVLEKECCAAEWIHGKTLTVRTTVTGPGKPTLTSSLSSCWYWARTERLEKTAAYKWQRVTQMWLTTEHFTLPSAESSVPCQRRCQRHWMKSPLRSFQ